MDPQWILAICAAVTLLILWSGTVIGGAIWLMRQLKELKSEILEEFRQKHAENSTKVAALEVLVIRHDTILDPEFNGSGHTSRRSR